MMSNNRNGQDQRSSTRSAGAGPMSSFPQYVDSSLTEMPTMWQGQNAISYATNAGNIPNHYDPTDEISFDDADNDLPMYWWYLSNEDKQGYLSLKNDIKPFITRTVRKDKAKKQKIKEKKRKTRKKYSKEKTKRN